MHAILINSTVRYCKKCAVFLYSGLGEVFKYLKYFCNFLKNALNMKNPVFPKPSIDKVSADTNVYCHVAISSYIKYSISLLTRFLFH